jgi:hypothetical protein
MLDNYQVDKITQYFYNRLSSRKKEALEQALESNKQFKSESAIYIDLINGFKSLELDRFKSDLRRWEKKYDTEILENVAAKRFRYSLKYAAALLLIICSTYTYQKHWVKPSVDALFAGYYNYQYSESNFQKFIQLRNINYFLSGMKWLESKHYANALENFRNYLLDETNISAGLNAEIYFYMGIACLELGQSKNAARYFKEVKQNKHSKFYQASEWYEALNLLKQRQVNPTIMQLKLLLKTKKHPYGDQAKKLLQELNLIDKKASN